MKIALSAAVCTLWCFAALAQQPASTFRQINDTVVAQFNRGDYKATYAMASQIYKDLNSEGELTGTLDGFKKDFGRVISSGLDEDLGDVKFFKWACEKGNLRFELCVNGSGIVQCKFSNLIKQPNAPNKPVITNNPLKTSLDSIVHKYASIYLSSPKGVGLSVGVYYMGKKYTYCYGEMEKGTGKPVTDETMFTVGSITKTFTGVLLARAVTEKKVKLDDDIRKYLDGSFPNLEYKGHPVTLLQLANHTAGFNRFRFNAPPANADNMTPAEWIQYFDTYTMDSLYRDLHVLKVDTMPGTNYHYSLIGTTLLNIMLEKVYHQPIDKIVRDYYSQTFNIKDTKLAADKQDMALYAQGYGENGELMPQMPYYTPSLSSIHSTTRDMLNYVQANVEEKNPAIRLSHQVTWGDLKTFAVGITWDMENYYGKYKQIWHSGYDYGSTTVCAAYPEIDLGIFIWANDDSRQGNLYDMERDIRESLLYLDSKKKQ